MLQEVVPNVTDMFGICFGNSGGSLAFGGAHSRHMQAGNLSWTPMRTTDGRYKYYTVGMQGISLGGEQVSADLAPALVDTGTTLLLLRPDLFQLLVRFFQERYPHLPGVTGNTSVLSAGDQYCLNMGGTPDWSAWPTIELQLDGLVLQLPPSLYFWPQANPKSPHEWCFGIQPTPASVSTSSPPCMHACN